MATSAADIKRQLAKLGNAGIAAHSQRFFKTGKGEYGEGDRFRGIRVPVIRQQVRKHRAAGLRAILAMLKSRWHEDRLFAVLSLVDRFKSGDESMRRTVFNRYLENTRYVNNWDLVDSSAHLIVGPWLEDRSRKRLATLARSGDLWKRRIAIMSTYHYIRHNDFADTLEIATILLNDSHDLIHKAVGWMLREVGNRDKAVEVDFLKKHHPDMPRTMLRYAIEKFPRQERQAWLAGEV